MKKSILLTLALSLGLTSINAQITIRENDVVEKSIIKPKQFDSLSNITMQKHPVEYKKFIGYKLFYLPKSKNYKSQFSSDNKEEIKEFLFTNDTIQIIKDGKIPFENITLTKIYGYSKSLKGAALEQYNERKKNYENIDKILTNVYKPRFYHEKTDQDDGKIYGEIRTYPDSIFGKYFTIIDIKGKETYGSKEYKKLEDLDLEDDGGYQLNLKITLRNESNQDILYWEVQQARFLKNTPFFLVPYFEKQRNTYINQNLVLRYSDRYNSILQNLIDVNTGATINIKYGEVWTCSDISFVDSKDSYHLKGFYFLKNGDREVKIELGSNLVNDYFMLETEFKKQELEKQKKEEQRQKEQLEREKKQQQERIKFKNDCIAKWGQKMGSYIADGKVVLGMNKEICTAAWGSPININRTIVRGLTSEQWVYGWGTYLYFDNGVLSAIQD